MRSAYAPNYAEQMGSVIALTGTLVDLAANLRVSTHLSGDDREQIRLLARQRRQRSFGFCWRKELTFECSPCDSRNVPRAIPLVTEMEKTVQLMKRLLRRSTAQCFLHHSPQVPVHRRCFLFVMRSPR